MKTISKNYIFTSLLEAPNASLYSILKTFRKALYWHLPFGVGTVGVGTFTRPLYLLCISTHRNLFRIRHARIYNNGLKRNHTTANQRMGVTQVSIMNKQGGATSYLKPSDMTNDRLLQGLNKIGVYFQTGVGGKLLLPRSLTSFPLAGLNFNN